MPYLGLDPELTRELSLAMRQAGIDAEDIGAEALAALVLSELDSQIPGELEFLGDDLDDVGLIVSARVDLAEGLVLDPVVLAGELGLSEAQVEKALAALSDETNLGKRKNLTPFFELRARAEAGGEVLRGSFVDLPPPGQDLLLDEALEELGLFLPDALVEGELDVTVLSPTQLQALNVLAAALVGPLDGPAAGGSPAASVRSALGIGEVAAGPTSSSGATFARMNFASIANAFELDQRLAAAAGLPTIEDIIYQANRDLDLDIAFDDALAPLDDFLPALLVGEGKIPTDPAQLALTVSFARRLGFTGTEFDSALSFLKGRRFLQRSLISGEFEGVDGPLLVWTENGVNNALLAGRRNGALDDVSRQQAEFLAARILAGDGSGNPVELSDAEIQALGAIVIGQNGEEFLLENPQIQRQLISAINLIGRQPTLADQQRLFADSIEAFRSLAVVGAPAMTYRQLKEAVGPVVSGELSYKYLTARSAKATAKRPQFVSLLNHWGIPGGDTLKLKKRKFSFEFDESGQLSRIRNKKLSKWKRFKNAVKAIGKALKQEWKDNPWGVIWEGVKIVAAAVLTVVPGTNAIGAAMLYTSLAVLVADMAYQATKGHWMEALSSGLTALSGGASYFAQSAATANAASKVAKVANAGRKVLAAVEHGDEFIDAVKDGDVLGAIGSGAAALANGARAFPAAETVGTTSNLVATGAEFVVSGVDTVNAGLQVVDAIEDGDALGILASSFSLLSSGLDAAEKGGRFANSSSAFASGKLADQGIIDEAAKSDIGGGVAQGLEDEYTHRVFSSDTLNAFGSYAGTAADAARLVNTGGSVIDGDYIGAAQQGVQFLGSEVEDEQTKLVLAAADKGLGVAKIVDNVYRGGAVPEGDQIFNALFELGAAAGAAFAGPADPVEPVEPVRTVAADGSVEVDYNGDGVIDAVLSKDEANGRGVVELDLDGDGQSDVAFVDNDGDGRGDARYVEPPPPPPPLGPVLDDASDTVTGRGIRLAGFGADDASGRGRFEAGAALLQTADGVQIVHPDGTVEELSTHQLDQELADARADLARAEASGGRARLRNVELLQAEVDRLEQLRESTPEGVAEQVETLRELERNILDRPQLGEAGRDQLQEIRAELNELGRLHQVSHDGLVISRDRKPRQLIDVAAGDLLPPGLELSAAQLSGDFQNTAGDAVGAASTLLLEVAHGIKGANIPGGLDDALSIAVESGEALHAAGQGGAVGREIAEGAGSLVVGGLASAAGAPGVVVFGVTTIAETGIGYGIDLATYKPVVESYQLATGEIVTSATTGASDRNPYGVPVSVLNIDNGTTVETFVRIRSGERELVFDPAGTESYLSSLSQQDYPEAHREITDLLRGERDLPPSALESSAATGSLRAIEDLMRASADHLPAEVVERFSLPQGRQ